MIEQIAWLILSLTPLAAVVAWFALARQRLGQSHRELQERVENLETILSSLDLPASTVRQKVREANKRTASSAADTSLQKDFKRLLHKTLQHLEDKLDAQSASEKHKKYRF